MKSRITTCLIYLSTLPFLSFAQQAALPNSRALTPFQLFETQRGEAENFKTLVYRFEVAWQEADLQSMVDLKAGLEKMMLAENEQAVPAQLDAEKAAARLLAKQQCLESVKKTPLSINDGAVGKKAEQLQTLFQDYIKLMETELSEQMEKLRKAEKQ